MRASIRWPSGLVQELHDLATNHRVGVEEDSEEARLEAFNTGPQGLKPLRLSGHRPAGLKACSPRDLPKETEPLPTAVETWLPRRSLHRISRVLI